MSHGAVTVAYDGPALARGAMDVRDLAPALLALGELCSQGNKALNGPKAEIRVSVKANFERGSFGIALDMEQVGTWLSQLTTLLTSDGANALVNAHDLIELLFGLSGTLGLVGLVRRTRGERLKSKVRISAHRCEIQTEDGITIEVPDRVVTLYESGAVRGALEGAIEPLKRDGIDVFQVREGTQVREQVERHDVPSFAAPDIEEMPVTDTVYEQAFTIISPAFKDDNKWRLGTGDGTFPVAMEDARFLALINSGEPFRKGDILRCRVRLRQWKTTTGLRDERAIIEVLEHSFAPQQQPLI